jgi:hypothetical protein
MATAWLRAASSAARRFFDEEPLFRLRRPELLSFDDGEELSAVFIFSMEVSILVSEIDRSLSFTLPLSKPSGDMLEEEDVVEPP